VAKAPNKTLAKIINFEIAGLLSSAFRNLSFEAYAGALAATLLFYYREKWAAHSGLITGLAQVIALLLLLSALNLVVVELVEFARLRCARTCVPKSSVDGGNLHMSLATA